jgi:hypothetical protein
LTYGTNNYTDVAVDATYQYMANPKHIFEVKTSYIYEDQNYQQLERRQVIRLRAELIWQRITSI